MAEHSKLHANLEVDACCIDGENMYVVAYGKSIQTIDTENLGTALFDRTMDKELVIRHIRRVPRSTFVTVSTDGFDIGVMPYL